MNEETETDPIVDERDIIWTIQELKRKLNQCKFRRRDILAELKGLNQRIHHTEDRIYTLSELPAKMRKGVQDED